MANHMEQPEGQAPRFLGNYRLLHVLGRGAFATVYLGEHLYLERLAAIKVLHVRIEPQTHEVFQREARIIAQLDHPHIMRVHEFGLEDQIPYLVLEYTQGGTLRQRYPKGTRLSYEEIVTYVKQIASALDYAHQQRVIHRDIKPENILLNAKHEVVLSDFGIAVVQHTLDSLSTQNPAGTPLYMAPEQIQRQPCAASDQYALAVMVYEWLCGEPPFHGSLFEVFSQHVHKPPPSLCARVKELPSAVENAVMQALAKDPQQRFVCVANFASALEEAFLTTRPLSLRRSVEHEPQNQTNQSVAHTPLASVRSLNEQEPSDNATQLDLKTVQDIEHEHELVQSISPQPTRSQNVPKPAIRSLEQTNRERLLRRVHTFWIKGVLEQSLHGADLMALGLQEQPDAIANPWYRVLQPSHTESHSLPAGTRIAHVYDTADGELLILGAPGAGKTTLLLELAQVLLERVEHDKDSHFPIVFNLSSWAEERRPFSDWMIKELRTKYQVSRSLAKMLVKTNQVLPLLDGLDEMSGYARKSCVKAIETYRQKGREQGIHRPIVICCRSQEYQDLSTHMHLNCAISVQPLTDEQVQQYLASVHGYFDALQETLQEDDELSQLARRPLMLSIFALAYQGAHVADLPTRNTQYSQWRQLFATYVERMLSRRRPCKGGKVLFMHWLNFLARRMSQQDKTVFSMETLRPDWLVNAHKRFAQWSIGLVGGLFFGLFLGLSFGLFLNLLAGLPFNQILNTSVGSKTDSSFSLSFMQYLYVLLASLLGPLLFYLPVIRVKPLASPDWLVHNLFEDESVLRVMLRSGRRGMWLFRLLCRPLLGWQSLGDFGRFIRMLFYMIPTLFVAFIYSLYSLCTWVLGGLICGLISGWICGWICGQNVGQSIERLEQNPHPSIERAMSSLLQQFGEHPQSQQQIHALIPMLVTGCVMLVTAFIGMSGRRLPAFAQYLTLRFWLWQTGSLPWDLTSFLEEAVDRLILYRAGTGYLFVHRLLLDYLAAPDDPQCELDN